MPLLLPKPQRQLPPPPQRPVGTQQMPHGLCAAKPASCFKAKPVQRQNSACGSPLISNSRSTAARSAPEFGLRPRHERPAIEIGIIQMEAAGQISRAGFIHGAVICPLPGSQQLNRLEEKNSGRSVVRIQRSHYPHSSESSPPEEGIFRGHQWSRNGKADDHGEPLKILPP